jgi:cytochrome c oxidase subunit II
MFDISEYLGLPANGAAHGAELDYMLGLVHWLMFILLVIWTPFFIYTLIRFRASKNPQASYTGTKSHISTYLEIGVIVAEAVLLIGFAIPVWAQLKVDRSVSEKADVVVHVVAEQFAWNIHYPGPDGIFGKRDIKLVDTATNPLGLDETDPNGKDDVTTINELHLPIDKQVVIHLTSKDVIHCFSLPIMRIKQDIIPGLSIPVHFTPTMTGKSDLGCAQLCGLGHYRMHGYLYVLTAEEYEDWMKTALEEKEEFAALSSD